MSRQITITLPNTIAILGIHDAPEELKEVSTEKWDEYFCLTALSFGIHQKLGLTWKASKKNRETLARVHERLTQGNRQGFW